MTPDLTAFADACRTVDGVADATYRTKTHVEPRRETRTVEEPDTRVVRNGGGVTTETVIREREVTRTVGEKQVTDDVYVEVILDNPAAISTVIQQAERHGLTREAFETVDVDSDARQARYRVRPPAFQ